MSEAVVGYLAGILDGEGTITISRKKHSKGYYYRPLISVTNTNPALLKWLVAATGIGAVSGIKQTREIHHKPYFRWDVWSKQAASVAAMAFPFLVLKREQAELLLRFSLLPAYTGGSVGRSAEEWEAQRLMWERMALLNKRGR